MLEALASDLPLILSRAPGNLDFATLGLDHVYWAPPRDPAKLATAIQDWAQRISGHGEKSNHRAIAEGQFSLETGYARLLTAYREVLSTPNEAPQPSVNAHGSPVGTARVSR